MFHVKVKLLAQSAKLSKWAYVYRVWRSERKGKGRKSIYIAPF